MSIAGTRAADGLERRAFTALDVRRMVDVGILGEDGRTELVEGDIVVLKPKVYAHELIKNALSAVVMRSVSAELMVGVATSVQFSQYTILEPDLIVFEKSSLLRSDADFFLFERGNPRLVIDIAAASLPYDKGLKAPLYARYGVPELWVIDADAQITWIHRGLRNDSWSSVVEYGPNHALTTPILPGFSVRLADLG